MTNINIAEAAQILKVNKKTLMRWDSEGRFLSNRGSNGYRYYDHTDICQNALWLDIRREHKAHIRKLKKIREAVDQFASTKPLDPLAREKLHNFKEMKEAFDSLRGWEKEEKRILKRYGELPEGFKHKVDAE